MPYAIKEYASHMSTNYYSAMLLLLLNLLLLSASPFANALNQPTSYQTKRKNPRPSILQVERSIQRKGYQYIIGCDEVGRGAIAGPVLAAGCCIVLKDVDQNTLSYDDGSDDDDDMVRSILLPGVADSKTLTPEERYEIYHEIKNTDRLKDAYKWSFAQRSAHDISKSNILKATMGCFHDVIRDLVLNENLPLERTYAIVDGNKTPKLKGGPTPVSCRPYVKADSKVYTVSLASIMAKCERDDIMVRKYHRLYPKYGFDENKGYSTRKHIEAIHRYGPCPIHRSSFKPLKGR